MNDQKESKTLKDIVAEAERIRKRLNEYNQQSQSIRDGVKLSGGGHDKENHKESNRSQSSGKLHVRRTDSRLEKVRKQSVRLCEGPRTGFNPQRVRNVSSGLIKYSSDKNVKMKNNKIMSKIKNHQSGITNNYSFGTPMPRLESEVTSLNGIDKIRLRGTEYLTSVLATTTAGSPLNTTQGDLLYSIPLNPYFFRGTRFVELARLYTKYKWKHFTVEWIPVVPSTQNGSVIMYFSYDPEENNFLQYDPDDRLRRSLSHLGAVDFNVYTYGKCTLIDDHQLDSYYCKLENDVRFENQGQLNIVAGSSYSPSMLAPEEESIELGQLLIHYELELQERALTEDLGSTIFKQWVINPPVQWDAYSDTGAVDVPIDFKVLAWNTLLGVTLQPWHLIVVVSSTTFFQGPATPVATLGVRTDNTPDGGVPLFAKGSIWYLRMFHEDFDFLRLYDNLQDALQQENPAHLEGGMIGTNVIQAGAKTWIYDTRSGI